MRTLLIAWLVVACGKTSTPTPDNTGSGTTTTNSSGTVIAAGSAGSGSSAVPPIASTDLFDKAANDLVALKVKMCGCKDRLCTATVWDEFKLWRVEIKKASVGKRPTKPQDDKINASDKEMQACRTAIDVAVVGGSGSAAPGTGDPIDVALVELDGLKAKMCACADKPCADRIQADFATWRRLMRTKITAKPNSVQELRGKALDNDIQQCRSKAERATPGAVGSLDKLDAMIVKMASYRDRACACRDKTCADAVTKDMETWHLAIAKDLADAKPTKDQDDRFDKIDSEIRACKTKLK